MQLHQLQPIHKQKQKKRVGRGGTHGFHCGKGSEGQKSRAGKRLKPLIRETIKKYPKLRGYRFKRTKLKPAIINLEVLEKKFNSEEKITPQLLLEKNLIRRKKGKVPSVKILGEGKITKPLIIENCQISKKALEKIEKAGGKII